jgi:hypothetical protein
MSTKHPPAKSGVTKKLLQLGRGEAYPMTGNFVDIHYTGRLAECGTEFDSSLDYDAVYCKPYRFEVGGGKVIAGFDVAARTMLVGEKAEFTIEAEQAYGDIGSSAPGDQVDIPPGARLIFEMELVAIVCDKAADDLAEANAANLAALKISRKEAAEAKAKEEARLAAKKKEREMMMEKKRMNKKGAKKLVATHNGPLDRLTVKKMKPKEMKAVLSKRGLSTQGNKKELQKRLLALCE